MFCELELGGLLSELPHAEDEEEDEDEQNIKKSRVRAHLVEDDKEADMRLAILMQGRKSKSSMHREPRVLL